MTTPSFTISASAYMREMASLWLGRLWPVPVALLVAVAVWSFYDLRAVYVGLIMIFLIYPMAMSFVWFHYAFSPAALQAVAPKHLMIGAECIKVEFDSNGEREPQYDAMALGAGDIRSVEVGKKHYAIVYGTSPECRILIPTDVLDSDMKRALIAFSPAADDAVDMF